MRTSHESLAEEHPNLVLQWAPESNGSKTPWSVPAASPFKAAWRCGTGCEHCGTAHEWTASVRSRAQLGRGCPLCSGRKTCRCRSVAAMHPELMKQWDEESNQGIDPYSVGCYSKMKVSWRCAEHDLWERTPNYRVYYKSGCPECARQQTSYQRRGLLKEELPDVHAELHPTKNAGVDMETLSCGSGKRVWWLCQSTYGRPAGCQHDHEWEAQVAMRCRLMKPAGCPFCIGMVVCPCKSLAQLQPALLQYWDVTANTIPLAQPIDPLWLGVHSGRKVWWRHECADGQVCRWIASVSHVAEGFGAKGRMPCPRCSTPDRYANRQRRRKLIKRNKG